MSGIPSPQHHYLQAETHTTGDLCPVAIFWHLASLEVWGGTRGPGPWQRRLGAGTGNALEASRSPSRLSSRQGRFLLPTWNPSCGAPARPQLPHPHSAVTRVTQGNEVMAPRVQSPRSPHQSSPKRGPAMAKMILSTLRSQEGSAGLMQGPRAREVETSRGLRATHPQSWPRSVRATPANHTATWWLKTSLPSFLVASGARNLGR